MSPRAVGLLALGVMIALALIPLLADAQTPTVNPWVPEQPTWTAVPTATLIADNRITSTPSAYALGAFSSGLATATPRPTGQPSPPDATPSQANPTTGDAAAAPPPSGSSYLSDLTWASVANGYGPAERDMSNGEDAAGDGGPITLNGVTYAKGIGVNAPSEIVYDLGGACATFVSDIGVDDDVRDRGSVVFEVWVDGSRRSVSPTMTGASPTNQVTVDLKGARALRLVVSDGGDGNAYDHADWAGAQVACGADQAAPLPMGVAPASQSSGSGASAASADAGAAAQNAAPPGAQQAAQIAQPPMQAMLVIESPEADADLVAGEQASITGWAVDPTGPGTGVTSVDVYLDELSDDGLVGAADYGLARQDVASTYSRPDWANAGFAMEWTLPDGS